MTQQHHLNHATWDCKYHVVFILRVIIEGGHDFHPRRSPVFIEGGHPFS